MTNKIAIIALGTLLSFCNAANAGVILYVSFGDNAQNYLSSESQLVSSFSLGSQSHLTANIYMHLTEGTPVYGYRFSVRYNGDLLAFGNRTEVRPTFKVDDSTAFFVADTAVESEGGAEPDPVGQSLLGPQISGGMDLYRFNGIIPTDDNLVDPGFFKVAEITFTFKQPTLTAGTLVLPGAFEGTPKELPLHPDDVYKDGIKAIDSEGDPVGIGFSVQGGFVPGGTVPEPVSGVIFGILASIALFNRKNWARQKELSGTHP